MFGVFSLFQTIINGTRRCTESVRDATRPDDDENGGKKPSTANRGGGCCECLISLFLFAWLIVGSVWVFGFWNTYNSPGCDVNCCHPVPYLFSFVTIIVMYVVGFLSCMIGCCCCCCFGCYLFAVSHKEELTASE